MAKPPILDPNRSYTFRSYSTSSYPTKPKTSLPHSGSPSPAPTTRPLASRHRSHAPLSQPEQRSRTTRNSHLSNPDESCQRLPLSASDRISPHRQRSPERKSRLLVARTTAVRRHRSQKRRPDPRVRPTCHRTHRPGRMDRHLFNPLRCSHHRRPVDFRHPRSPASANRPRHQSLQDSRRLGNPRLDLGRNFRGRSPQRNDPKRCTLETVP